jgi:UTP:GlnB (protein PII) uridylyltransferase
LTHAGLATQNLFPSEAIDLIYTYTQGIPRLINSLCDASLQTGFALQSAGITAAIINEVARDLDLVRSVAGNAPAVNGHMALVSAGMNGGPSTAQQPPATNGNSHNAKNGHVAPEVRIPMETYTRRQQSLSFFGGLMERWK